MSILAAAVCVLGGGVALKAATVSVTDSVATFTTLETPWGSVLSDSAWDQQTGQGADDFVGDGANGHYGFYYKFGQISGVDSMVFRFRFNVLDTQQGNPKFTGNVRLGVDGDGDGNVDLFFGISTGQGQTPEIVFQNPTGTAADANTSPNTSALGNSYGTIASSSTNFSIVQANDGSNYGTGNNNNANVDSFLTFALPFSTFKTYLEAQLSGVTISLNSLVRYVAFTSTQGNSVNQDVYGMAGIGTVRYDQGGGFTNYYGSNGSVIPEASTFAQFALLALGGLAWRRKRAVRDRSS